MNRKYKLYLETTIPSYIAARPSRDIVVLAHQQITQDWWDNCKEGYEMYISQIVIEEIISGDPSVANERFSLIEDFHVLDLTNDIEKLTSEYMEYFNFPKHTLRDAFHLAFSVGYEMDILLTWNCKHLANEAIRKKLRTYNESRGLTVPSICTPEELLTNHEEEV